MATVRHLTSVQLLADGVKVGDHITLNAVQVNSPRHGQDCRKTEQVKSEKQSFTQQRLPFRLPESI